MNRAELEAYILETYHAEKDYPWMKYPEFAVFRHSNRKGFAFVLNVRKDRLGMTGDEFIDIVNLKCDSAMIGSLLLKDGIYPAYHMNKEHWITVVLDESVTDDMIKMLVEISYTATEPKGRK